MSEDREQIVSRLIELQQENDSYLCLLERCNTVLTNMARENKGWSRFLSRWEIPAEPLRNDAHNLLPLLHAALYDDVSAPQDREG